MIRIVVNIEDITMANSSMINNKQFKRQFIDLVGIEYTTVGLERENSFVDPFMDGVMMYFRIPHNLKSEYKQRATELPIPAEGQVIHLRAMILTKGNRKRGLGQQQVPFIVNNINIDTNISKNVGVCTLVGDIYKLKS